MAVSTNGTKLANIVNPEVMGDMISAELPNAIALAPLATVGTELQGRAGDTIKFPVWNYIGDAEDVAEGAEVDLTAMTAGTKTFTIKKAMKAVGITQEAVNSAHGNIIGETETQLAKAIAGKVDADVLAALLTASAVSGNGSAGISYEGIVDAVGVFNEEEITEKVMFVNPAQVTTLRKDANFISADKYNFNVVATGEIGTIAGVHIVPSRRIVASGDVFTCPIVKLEAASPETEYTEDELAAVTIFLKKDIQTDADWIPRKQTHEITTAKYYGVALTNEAKVVLAKFDATPAV